jgi:hypothetical protein
MGGGRVAKEKSVKNERDNKERRSTEERAPIDMSFAQGVDSCCL